MHYVPGDIFLKGPNWQLNACVGKNGGPYDFLAYSRGYFRAAQHLVASVVEGGGSLDLLIYPTIYLYRHAFELGLKHLSRSLLIAGESSKDYAKTHRLSSLWRDVESELRRHPTLFEPEQITSIGHLLTDLDMLDSSAEVFRFPEAKSGEAHLQDRSILNYARLRPLAEAEKVFELWGYCVDGIAEYKKA